MASWTPSLENLESIGIRETLRRRQHHLYKRNAIMYPPETNALRFKASNSHQTLMSRPNRCHPTWEEIHIPLCHPRTRSHHFPLNTIPSKRILDQDARQPPPKCPFCRRSDAQGEITTVPLFEVSLTVCTQFPGLSRIFSSPSSIRASGDGSSPPRMTSPETTETEHVRSLAGRVMPIVSLAPTPRRLLETIHGYFFVGSHRRRTAV